MTSFVIGSSGLLGRYIVKNLLDEKQHVVAFYNKNLVKFFSDSCIEFKCNLRDKKKMIELMHKKKPKCIFNCSGFTNVDECEKNETEAQFLNVEVVKFLAKFSKEEKIKFVQISTDHLFDGRSSFYNEIDTENPINIYAKTKFMGEKECFNENKDSLIIRTNFFGKGTKWRKSFTDFIWEELNKGNNINGFTDCFFTPISATLLSKIIIKLINKNAKGIFNICGSERVSKYEFAIKFANFFGLDKTLIKPSKMNQHNFLTTRPVDMSLNTEKINKLIQEKMPSIIESLKSIKNEYN